MHVAVNTMGRHAIFPFIGGCASGSSAEREARAGGSPWQVFRDAAPPLRDDVIGQELVDLTRRAADLRQDLP
jgi:hypothetical protein